MSDIKAPTIAPQAGKTGADAPLWFRLMGSQSLRAACYQLLLGVLIVYFSYWLYANVEANLRTQNIATGFGFLGNIARFEIGEKLIDFTARDNYYRALATGLLNTLYVTGWGIVLATLLGFAVGIARVSANGLLAYLASGYIELMRNIPVILQVIFWSVLIRNLPSPRDAITLGDLAFLTNRGLTFALPAAHTGWRWCALALLTALIASLALAAFGRRLRERRGHTLPTGMLSATLIVGLPLLAWWLSGAPHQLNRPVLQGFNFQGGGIISPEFTALLLGIALYSSAFIAEIVRSGIQSIPKGQLEAANALSLSRWQILSHIIIPQALRVIVPPLTSQFVSLSKNSSIAVVVGYPDLTNISNTLMNQTGQALEVIAIMMVVYLTFSLLMSLLMNVFNRIVAIKER
ncbi:MULTISPECIES: amino acid ABC transporter permease [Dickeya]|uniref:Amino-acid transporter subunit membrane component of ABC superfamily n=1 Tax=Dickeya aquatica TaxID=1401087 RepID=A0A375AFV3_9GAMM|nr:MULTISPECIES: ABC transporter permease subunit [Dickeya]SLM64982.1 amino-acid transporter subunit; membrane component of ABC superfamily [Dickeya aquatica]